VDLKEELQQSSIAQKGRVEDHFYRLRVPMMIIVGRRRHLTADISDARRDDPPLATQQILQTPEAAAGEYRSLRTARPISGNPVAFGSLTY